MIPKMVAKRLIELCKEGKFTEAQQELYDTDIISVDPDGSKTVGASNMNAKERRFLDSLEKIHTISYSEPLFAGNYFTVILRMEIEIKNNFDEVCIYQVADGKIVFEQFFRDIQKTDYEE
jgi:hypothetical protein